MSTKSIECEKHGTGEMVHVCNHIVLSMRDSMPRGVFVWKDESGTTCAWCQECALRAEASDQGPNRVPLKFQVENVCSKCFEVVRTLNGGGILYR
jgi:hypothetical protein